MLHSLEVDIAALQQLPETEPLTPSFADGGLCIGVTIGANSCLSVINTCKETNGSAPTE